MKKVQSESVTLSEMEAKLAVLDRKLQIQRRVQDVFIQIALQQERDEPLHQMTFAYLGIKIDDWAKSRFTKLK
jgi:hypothetical protein|tara:strand:- start:1495 stop:1713 length:219 start_codon:yes stop_codon:yes gene_type:complete